MALQLADTGAVRILKVFFDNTAKPSSLVIKLYTNNFTPDDSTTSGDLTEAAGGGYATKSVMTNVAYVSPVAITSSSAASPTEITTSSAHGLSSSDIVTIENHSGSASNINGTHTITVTGASTFTIPVDLTSGGGTGGTVARGWTQAAASGIEQVTADTVPFVFTGALTGSATIYGYWVEDNAGNFMWAEKLSSSYTPVSSGDTLNIDPVFQLSKGTPT